MGRIVHPGYGAPGTCGYAVPGLGEREDRGEMSKAWMVGIAAALCATAALADLTSDLAGRTLVGKGGTYTLNADGTMTGKAGKADLEGTWEISDGRFCRTISKPAKHAGSECQGIAVDGSNVTITRADGSTAEFVLQ